jgi:putative hemolysin
MLAIELIAVFTLILLNGMLALSELAVVSSRRSRLKAMEQRGVRGAAAALQLASDPGRFLSTVQIGITLIGVLSGAFSGSTLGLRLALRLEEAGAPDRYAEVIGIGVVVVLITYLSVVIGELVPKQVALRNPERFAVLVAPAMNLASKVARPVVAVLDLSGRLLLRLLRMAPQSEDRVSDEEIRSLIAEAETAGVIEPEERQLIAGVMRLGDRSVRDVMTPRGDVEMIDLSQSTEEILSAIRSSRQSRLPVHRGDPDVALGIIQSKDLLDAFIDGADVDPGKFVRQAPVVPDTVTALDALDLLRKSPEHMALVHDEYGQFEGIVTNADILEAIAGVFHHERPANRKTTRRADGSWLIDGDMRVDEAAELLGLDLPEDRPYQTVAGLLLELIGHIPATGEDAVFQGWRFEVMDLDGRRIDKILAMRVPARR